MSSNCIVTYNIDDDARDKQALLMLVWALLYCISFTRHSLV
jgi:hypothetical protein